MQRWSPEVIRYLHTAADRSRYYTDLARDDLGLASDGERIFYDVNN